MADRPEFEIRTHNGITKIYLDAQDPLYPDEYRYLVCKLDAAGNIYPLDTNDQVKDESIGIYSAADNTATLITNTPLLDNLQTVAAVPPQIAARRTAPPVPVPRRAAPPPPIVTSSDLSGSSASPATGSPESSLRVPTPTRRAPVSPSEVADRNAVLTAFTSLWKQGDKKSKVAAAQLQALGGLDKFLDIYTSRNSLQDTAKMLRPSGDRVVQDVNKVLASMIEQTHKSATKSGEIARPQTPHYQSNADDRVQSNLKQQMDGLAKDKKHNGSALGNLLYVANPDLFCKRFAEHLKGENDQAKTKPKLNLEDYLTKLQPKDLAEQIKKFEKSELQKAKQQQNEHAQPQAKPLDAKTMAEVSKINMNWGNMPDRRKETEEPDLLKKIKNALMPTTKSRF